MKLKLFAACFFSALPAALSAQALRGVVVDQLDRPLTGVVLQLTDSASRAVARVISNERGEFRLTARVDGTYRLKSTRIGFRPMTSEPIALSSAAEVTRRITLVSNPVVLDPVRSVVNSTCRAMGLDSNATSFTAWQQVQAALAGADATAESKQLRTTTLSYDRTTTLDGFVVRQHGVVSTAEATQPWHSVSADSLRRVGYVVMDADKVSRIFNGPDVRVLGSQEFLEDHCFHVVAGQDTSRIGVAFEPTSSRRDMPEIIGTVWLDRATSELRDVEWQYVNVAKNIDETATGGALRFAHLRNGLWVISKWSIRMPLTEIGGGAEHNSVTFRGTKINGGELVSAAGGSGTDTLWTAPPVKLHGFAFDSLNMRAMTAALIGISGSKRRTVTDSAGYFTFPDLIPGAYNLITQHDAMEAIGVPYQVTSAVITSDLDSVVVTIPSFETMWRLACESVPPGKDTALVYGTIRAAGRPKPVRNATVVAAWVDVTSTGKGKFDTKRWHLDTPTDSAGSYVLCGIPAQTGLRMRAVTDSAESGIIDVLPLNDRRVARRDLMVSFDARSRGVVTGTVKGRNAVPLAGARVVAEGAHEVRTDLRGRFTLRDVPLGTQQVEVTAVGLQPVARVVDVTLTDTASLEILVTKPVMLQRVNIVASSVRQQFVNEFNDRRVKGLGTFRDSTAIGAAGTLSSAFMQIQGVRMVRNQIYLPRIAADPGSPGCVPIVWIDNVHVQSTDDLVVALRPSDIAAIEVYQRELTIPPQFVVRDTRTPPCGAIVAWTKWFWEGNQGSTKPPG
jgi:hypothetical protein